MDEAEMTGLEDRYFHDDGFFEFCEAMEDELIAQYLRGDLSREESERFEGHYLNSTERRERAEFASAVRGMVQDLDAPQTGLFAGLARLLRGQSLAVRCAMAGAAVAIVIGVALPVARMVELGRGLEELSRREAAASHRARAAEQQIEAERTMRGRLERALSGASALALALAPATRDSREVVVALGEASFLELRLALEGRPAASRYRVVLRTASQPSVWNEEIREAAPKAPVVRVPAAILGEDSYQVELESVDSQGQFTRLAVYTFRVTGK
jgi:hypothetical protein